MITGILDDIMKVLGKCQRFSLKVVRVMLQ